MNSRRYLVALIMPLAAALPTSAAVVGPLLDEIMNCPRLGAHTPSRDDSRHATIEPDGAVGQTFRTGGDTEQVFRIAVWHAYWNESWQPDETVVMTLWDSPAKNTAYGRCEMPYARRMWEGAVAMYTLQSRVQPDRDYYFELTVEIEPLRPAELPREWVLSGKRPGFAGGDGKVHGLGIAAGDYTDGTAYVRGEPRDYDLWFEIHAKPPVDRDALFSEAFGRFDLDYEPLAPVRQAVARKDWETAAAALIAHFERREDLIEPQRRKPVFDPQYDTREADLAVAHKVLLEDGYTEDLGPTWNHLSNWPGKGGVGLTRSGLRKHLAAAYAHTGNEKYARAWNDMLAHFFLQLPSPLRSGVLDSDSTFDASPPKGLGGGGMWNGLSIGARLGHGFFYYAPFVESPSFTPDVRAAFIFNLAEMGDVLERQRGGGNWETQMAKGLMEVALTYPEFKRSRAWLAQGFAMLMENAESTVHPDGALHEPSIGYHIMVMRRYQDVVANAAKYGVTPPPNLAPLTEKMYEFVMFSTMPDSHLVPWGDTAPPFTPERLLMDAEYFGRADFRWVGSGGKQGQPPAELSRVFPAGGYFYMRDGWTRDARFLGLRCGPSAGHTHNDILSVVICAYGNQVLIDGGIGAYGTPEAVELTSSRAHNNITLDGRDGANTGTGEHWVIAENFDFFSGRNHGFAGLSDVYHRRQVCFLKEADGFPPLWLVLDEILGDNKERSAELRWRFAPLPVHADTASLTVWSTTTEGNIKIATAAAPGAAMELGEGLAMHPTRGGYTQVPVATISQRGPLPLRLASVLVPFRGAVAPPCTARTLESDPPLAQALWAETSGGAAMFAVVPDTARDEAITLALPDQRSLRMRARMIAVRFSRQGVVTDIHGVHVREVFLDDQPLWTADDARDILDQRFSN